AMGVYGKVGTAGRIQESQNQEEKDDRGDGELHKRLARLTVANSRSTCRRFGPPASMLGSQGGTHLCREITRVRFISCATTCKEVRIASVNGSLRRATSPAA